MKNLLHRALIAIALMTGLTPAIAQQFPTVPGQSVIGRLGIPGDTGPSQAIPLNTLGQVLSYTAPYTGAVPIPQRTYNAERLSVIEFGADPTGVADATSKIQSTMTAAAILGKCAFMPAGTYKISGTVTIGGNGTCLVGEGINSTILKSPNASNAIISVGNLLSGIHLSSFQLNRSVTATSGGDGIAWAISSLSDGFLDNIWSRNNYVGFHLGPTSLSFGYNLRAEGNITHGFLQTNNAAWGGNQWTMTNIYAGNNGIDGYCMCSDSGAVAGMGTGNMTNVYSFANGRHGLSAIGTAASPVNALRLFNVFLGQDNASELYLDSYSGGIQVVGGFYELAGTTNVGPNNATPPSHVGHGIEITPNNSTVQISNVLVTGMSQSGIVSSANTFVTIDGAHLLNNSNYGAVISVGAKASFAGSYFGNNTLGNLSVTSGLANLQVVGTTPTALNNAFGALSPSTMAVGGAALGGNAFAVAGSSSFTGNVAAVGVINIQAANAFAFSVGLNGPTNPAFNVDSSTALQAAGLNVKGAATGGTVAVSVIDSGANANVSFNAKGTGTIGIGSVSTGAVTITPNVTHSGTTTMTGAMTYGGVTLTNNVTGTGKMALDTNPTIDGATLATRLVKGVYIIGASAVQVSLTGTVAETTLATIAVPANVMGANGIIRITAQMSYTGGTAAWQTLIKHGGTTYINLSSANTLLSARFQTQVANRNATNSQVGTSISQANWAGNAAAVVTGSVDTTTSQNILINGLLTSAADTMKLESYLVELIVP